MKRFEKQHIEAVKLALEESKQLTKEKKIEVLTTAPGMDHAEPIASWLSQGKPRKRARKPVAAQLVQAHGQLQQALQLSQARAAQLQNELRESQRREAGLLAEYQLLKQQLIVARNVKRFGNIPYNRN